MPTLAQLRDLGSRALLTFTFFVLSGLLTVEVSGVTLTVAAVAALAGVGAVLALVKTFAAQQLGLVGGTAQDIVWRFVWTFVQAFTAALTVAGINLASLDTWQAALFAAIAAVLSLARSLAGQAVLALPAYATVEGAVVSSSTERIIPGSLGPDRA